MSFQRFDMENDVVENQKTTISVDYGHGSGELTLITLNQIWTTNMFLLGCLQ